METFYRFLGGPRTFWGGSNKVIINNYGCGPMFSGMCRPIFVNNNCFGGGLNRMFGFLAGMNILSNLFGYNNNRMATPYMGFNQTNMYNPYGLMNPGGFINQSAGHNNSSSIGSRLNSIEKEVKSLQKQIDDIEKAKCNCKDNGTSSTDKTDKSDKTDKASSTNNADKAGKTDKTDSANKANEAAKTDKTGEANKTDSTQNSKKAGDDKPKTIDELLNNIDGFDKLDSSEQQYVKNHIVQAYEDQNGNIKYNIRAVVHDGDTLDKIIDRFYNDKEKEELNVKENEYNSQISGKKVKNPNSGDTINANGVSEYGIKALMEDSKQKITKDGEIQKTNKKMSELKNAFIKGEKKLSKAYVLQNHMMSEKEYNKIIQNKYQ